MFSMWLIIAMSTVKTVQLSSCYSHEYHISGRKTAPPIQFLAIICGRKKTSKPQNLFLTNKTSHTHSSHYFWQKEAIISGRISRKYNILYTFKPIFLPYKSPETILLSLTCYRPSNSDLAESRTRKASLHRDIEVWSS